MSKYTFTESNYEPMAYPPLPPLYVIKNCALIFGEKWSCNGFLRTF